MLDTGPTFYAPQLLATDRRVLLWAWAWEHGRDEEQVAAAGWAGVLTFPRELTLDGSALVLTPAAELHPGCAWAPLEVLPGMPFTAGGLRRRPPVRPRRRAVAGARRRRRAGRAVVVACDPLVPPRLLVDGSLVEVFPGGPQSLTTRGLPPGGEPVAARPDRCR